MKRVTIYSRVNSVSQLLTEKENIQLEKLKSYCKQNNYEIVHTINSVASGKRFDHLEWKNWIELIESGKLKTDELIFTTWDRFSRDSVGAFNMIEKLCSNGIKVQAIEQPIDYAIPEYLFMLAIYLANPQIEFDRRSKRIKEGIRKVNEKRA